MLNPDHRLYVASVIVLENRKPQNTVHHSTAANKANLIMAK
jgi:hypothetical protein